MHISNQQSQVSYQYERATSRTLASSSTGNTQASAEHIEQSQADTPDIRLTPEQQVKQRLIQAMRQDKQDDPAVYNPHSQFGEIALASSEYVISASQVLAFWPATAFDSTIIRVHEHLDESEQLTFETHLLLNEHEQSTSLTFAFSFERQLSISRAVHMSVAEFKDPLILNLSGSDTLFNKQQQNFDLDGDGATESIPALNRGFWYLAFDRNQNVKIDNGSELFGARSGNGFAELSEFDSNQNGLVDPDDRQFGRLQLWNGHSHMQSLAEVGIQAVSLNAVQTPFTFTDDAGEARAKLRQSAVYITEQKRLGAVHQIDFAV